MGMTGFYTGIGIFDDNWHLTFILFQVGTLTPELGEEILSLGTGSYSWWWVNGAFCQPRYSTNATLIAATEGLYRPLKVKDQTCNNSDSRISFFHFGPSTVAVFFFFYKKRKIDQNIQTTDK